MMTEILKFRRAGRKKVKSNGREKVLPRRKRKSVQSEPKIEPIITTETNRFEKEINRFRQLEQRYCKSDPDKAEIYRELAEQFEQMSQ